LDLFFDSSTDQEEEQSWEKISRGSDIWSSFLYSKWSERVAGRLEWRKTLERSVYFPLMMTLSRSITGVFFFLAVWTMTWDDDRNAGCNHREKNLLFLPK
jgi:hypothetical protein